MINRSDTLHTEAVRVSIETQDVPQVTSVPVIIEVCDYFCERGEHFRRGALEFVATIRASPQVKIIDLTPELLDAGLDIYRRRPDKGYSLTDCMSMAICTEQKIEQVLTHDRHFSQEGFDVLL